MSAHTKFSTIAAAATLTLTAPGLAQASVVPSDRQRLEGSASTVYPLGRASCRFQLLTTELAAARKITGHAYRRDAIAQRGQIAGYTVELSVRLSISSVAPQKASTTFTANPGTSPTVVLPRSKIVFPSTQRPTLDPAPGFALRIPHKTAFAWTGKNSLCLDVSVFGNQVPAGKDRSFSPYLDAHELFTSGLNLQPGFVYGSGCGAPGQTAPARARFLVRRLGSGSLEGQLTVDRALATVGTKKPRPVLLLGSGPIDRASGLSGCRVRTSGEMTFLLPGAMDSRGAWTGKLKLGNVPVGWMFAQVAVFQPGTWPPFVLTDASRVSAPPVGKGLRTVRIANGQDRAAKTGSRAFSVPVVEFF